jgi:hypothetical protein
MKINLQQPKYVLPILLLPFLCFFFFVWRSGYHKSGNEAQVKTGLNPSVGEVSADVQKKHLADKLDTYRNSYKQAEGTSAVNAIPGEISADPAYRVVPGNASVSARSLDAIDLAMKARFRRTPGTGTLYPGNHPMVNDPDPQVARAIAELNRQSLARRAAAPAVQAKAKDPMEMFRQQMAYMDSMGKANDPEVKADRLKKEAAAHAAALKDREIILPVTRADAPSIHFNTVLPKSDPAFISAVIDESVTGYAGSRIKLRLLDPLKAGSVLVPKGTALYARISGFNEQRVALLITSILVEGKILPVKLQAYDLDGLAGLYVPSSAFREFTKDLGGSSVQGVTLDGGSGNSQFIMSTAGKLFQSTSSAIADLIRKNKAKLKYHSYLYLLDNEALQNAQKHD